MMAMPICDSMVCDRLLREHQRRDEQHQRDSAPQTIQRPTL